MSNNLETLCLLSLLISDCVYAQYFFTPLRQDYAYAPLMLYNPSTGQQLDPVQYSKNTNQKRSFLQGNQVNDKLVELPTMGWPCSCQDFACKCCLGMIVGILQEGLCITVTYNRVVASVNFDVKLNGRQLLNYEMSASQLPDICLPLLMPIPVFGCLRIYNIRIVEQNLHLCISLVLKVILTQIYEYKFACLQLSWAGVSILPATDQKRIGRRTEMMQ